MNTNSILFRYLFKMQTIVFIFAFLLVACIIFLIDVLDVIRSLSSKNLPVTLQAIKFSVYKSVELLHGLIPYIFLISGTITFRRLNNTDQMTILKNLGYSIYNIITSSVYLGLIIGFLNLFVIHPFSVFCGDRARVLHYVLLGKVLPLETKELWVQQKKDGSDKLIYIDKMEGKNLKTIVIYYFNDPKYKQIVADTATIGDKTWVLHNGAVITTDGKMDKFQHRVIQTSLKQRHLLIYGKDPINSDIFTIYNIIKLRNEVSMSTDTYTFQINLLIAKVLLLPLMAFVAILFCYTHHRYAYKTISLLATLISGLIIHFLSQALQSIGTTHHSSVTVVWGFLFMLYVMVLCCINVRESS